MASSQLHSLEATKTCSNGGNQKESTQVSRDIAESEAQVGSANLLNIPNPPLPDFDRSEGAFYARVFGLALAWCARFGLLVSSTYILEDPNTHCFRQVALLKLGAEALAFVINVFVALFTDALGYIHDTSLSWSLYREGRLDSNTNIRLLSSACKSSPNR